MALDQYFHMVQLRHHFRFFVFLVTAEELQFNHSGTHTKADSGNRQKAADAQMKQLIWDAVSYLT